ncbi:MAG TPA: cytochrome c [Thermoanaerobaculia bacterium]|nr:cytochrome c [Thermoanaerobaculia bacterium]
MKRTRLLAAAVFGAIAAMGLALFAAEAEHPSALFKEYCAKCHGEDGRGQTPKGKQLNARDFTDIQFQSDKTDADLIKIVTKGGEDMPAFGKKLTKEQIESLVKDDVRGFRKK